MKRGKSWSRHPKTTSTSVIAGPTFADSTLVIRVRMRTAGRTNLIRRSAEATLGVCPATSESYAPIRRFKLESVTTSSSTSMNSETPRYAGCWAMWEPKPPRPAIGPPLGQRGRTPFSNSLGNRFCAEGQNRTGDTSIFSAVLYQLSYLGLSR